MRFRSVYGWWQPVKSPPLDHCPDKYAKRLLELGLAESCNHGKAIRLLEVQRAPKRWTIRGVSCQMGPRVSQMVIEGVAYFRSLVEGWR